MKYSLTSFPPIHYEIQVFKNKEFMFVIKTETNITEEIFLLIWKTIKEKFPKKEKYDLIPLQIIPSLVDIN